MTCTAQKHGHKREATRSNIMGGSTVNKEWTPKGQCAPGGWNHVACNSNNNLTLSNPCWTEYNQQNTALLDSAASLSLIKASNMAQQIYHTHQPKTITIPNGETMQTSAELILNLPKLPPNARTAYLLPGLAHNLLALPQLCDNGCTVTFTKKGVEASIDGTMVL